MVTLEHDLNLTQPTGFTGISEVRTRFSYTEIDDDDLQC